MRSMNKERGIDAAVVVIFAWLAAFPPLGHASAADDAGVRRLEMLVAAEPERPGLQLDLAIALCQAGEWERAQREFLLLDSRPDLPTGIADVIGWYRGSKLCREPASAGWVPAHGFWAIGAGHQRNLNLGPSVDRLLIEGLNQVLELGEASRPKAARAWQAETGLTWDLGAVRRELRRWNFSLYGHAQSFDGYPQFRLQGLNGLLSHRQTDSEGGSAEWLLGSARLTLGDGTRLAAQTAHWSRLWAVGETQTLGGSVTLTLLDYAQRAALDARQVDSRLRWQWDRGASRWTSTVGWMEDREVRDRPGGDRRGPFFVHQWAWATPGGFSAEAQWRGALTEDRAAYSPALLGETRRRTRVSAVQMTLRQKLARSIQLRLDARWSRSTDRLPLFSYSASGVMLMVEHALGGNPD